MSKVRLDLLVATRYPSLSRNKIQAAILCGNVSVDGIVHTKSGMQVKPDALLVFKDDQPKYVSRAGFKLEAALDAFDLDPAGLVVLDAGISTGGFTDCLLQRGAACVYGVDVGYGQVHEKVVRDKRLVLYERTNLRNLTTLPKVVDLVTLDLSFISILKVMPAVEKQIGPQSRIITLIKPQFEADRSEIGKKGLVKSDAVHQKVIKKIEDGMRAFGFKMASCIDSPVRGASSGNKEFLALFVRG